MTLSAQAVRRRGDQIRRRRNALVVGGAALAVGVLAVPVLALAGIGGDARSDRHVAGDPTESPSAAVRLSEEDLLADEHTEYAPGFSDWFTVRTTPGDGQAPAHPCAASTYAGLGAGDVLQRDFEMRNLEPGAPEVTGSFFNQTIAQFDSDAAAREAYDTVTEWMLDCEGTSVTGYRVNPQARSVDVPTGDAVVYDAQWDYEGAEFDEGFLGETGIVLVGDRLSVLTHFIVGQDYNFLPDEGGTPLDRMVPRAADLLRPGGDSTAPAPVGTEAPAVSTWPTVIPQGFPLESGMPVDDGSAEFELEAPAVDNASMLATPGELQACGTSPAPGEPIDRLTTRLTMGSEHQVREIQLFADDTAATEYVATVGDLYGSCPKEDSGGSPPIFGTQVGDGAVGEQSLLVTRASDGVGRVVVTVVRVGNAVLVEEVSDEGLGSAVQDLATVARENLADVIGAMFELS